jgi:hypothetical protein
MLECRHRENGERSMRSVRGGFITESGAMSERSRSNFVLNVYMYNSETTVATSQDSRVLHLNSANHRLSH